MRSFLELTHGKAPRTKGLAVQVRLMN